MCPKKSVLITGCSLGGVGDALAQSFHVQGLRVFATARSLSKMAHLKKIGIETLALDVSHPDSLVKAVQAVRTATGGGLDVLVNNAGIGYSIPVLDADIQQTRDLFDTNVIGLVATTQAFAPLLLKSKGVIVNVGSVTGVVSIPWLGVYSASKAAVSHISDSLRLELAPFGVRVVHVIAGGITTQFWANTPKPALPANSLYQLDKDLVEWHMAGNYYDDINMPVKGVADKIVKNALNSRPSARIWVGGETWLVWLGSTFAPSWLQDWILYYKLGINLLKKKFLNVEIVSR